MISGIRFEDRRLGGMTLHCAEAGGAGEPVLLLHGYGDSGRSWASVIAHLPPEWRIVAPDQRGHGSSDRPAEGYTIAELARDAVALLDELGFERATVVGHSMGGLVALQLAIDHPERVARLVLAATTPRCAGPAVREIVDAVAAFGETVPRDFVEAFQASTLARPLPDELFESVVAESCRMPGRVWQALAREFTRYDARADLGRIVAPTWIVWGDADGIFDRADQETLRRGIRGATLSVYSGGGHALHWEDPERFA